MVTRTDECNWGVLQHETLALGTPALASKRGPVLRQTKTKGGRLALVVINENTTAGAALQAALVHYLHCNV